MRRPPAGLRNAPHPLAEPLAVIASRPSDRLPAGVHPLQRVCMEMPVNKRRSEPKPFVWTANPGKILAAVKRGRKVLEFDPLAVDRRVS